MAMLPTTSTNVALTAPILIDSLITSPDVIRDYYTYPYIIHLKKYTRPLSSTCPEIQAPSFQGHRSHYSQYGHGHTGFWVSHIAAPVLMRMVARKFRATLQGSKFKLGTHAHD